MTDIAEVVNAAREQLGPHGENWRKEPYLHSGVCLMMALDAGMKALHANDDYYDVWNPIAVKCNQLAGEMFPDRAVYDTHNRLDNPIYSAATFNDHPDTTFTDIEQLLDKLAVSDA